LQLNFFMKLLKRIFGSPKIESNNEAITILPGVLNKSFREIELIHYSNCIFLLANIYANKSTNSVISPDYNVLLNSDKILPLEMIDCKIKFSRIENIITGYGMKYINFFNKEGFGMILCNDYLKAFGNKEIAIVCESENDFIKHIWVSGKTNSEKQKIILQSIFLSFGVELDLVAVQWLHKRYFFLFSPDDVKDFIRHSF